MNQLILSLVSPGFFKGSLSGACELYVTTPQCLEQAVKSYSIGAQCDGIAAVSVEQLQTVHHNKSRNSSAACFRPEKPFTKPETEKSEAAN